VPDVVVPTEKLDKIVVTKNAGRYISKLMEALMTVEEMSTICL